MISPIYNTGIDDILYPSKRSRQMTFAEAKATAAAIEAEISAAEVALRAFPVGPMGLTPDAVKVTPEFRAAKKAFDASFAKLRAFNAVFTKTFSRELREERLLRRARG